VIKLTPVFLAKKPRTPRYSPQNERFSPLRFTIPPGQDFSKQARERSPESGNLPVTLHPSRIDHAPSPMQDDLSASPHRRAGRMQAASSAVSLLPLHVPLGGEGGRPPSGQLQLRTDKRRKINRRPKSIDYRGPTDRERLDRAKEEKNEEKKFIIIRRAKGENNNLGTEKLQEEINKRPLGNDQLDKIESD
jgi:hypothetical protein